MQKKGDPGVLKVREDTLSQAETLSPYTLNHGVKPGHHIQPAGRGMASGL